MSKDVRTTANLSCPKCDHMQEAEMPTSACQHFYKCESCKEIFSPKKGDCCVFCSYSDTLCPPKQKEV